MRFMGFHIVISDKQKGLISFLAVHIFLLTHDPLSNDQDQSSTSMNGLRNPKHNDVQVEGSDNSGGWYSFSTQNHIDDMCVEFQGYYAETDMKKIASAAAQFFCFGTDWTGDKGKIGRNWASATVENKRCFDRSKGAGWDQDELEQCWPAGTTFWMRNIVKDRYTIKAGTSHGQVCLYD